MKRPHFIPKDAGGLVANRRHGFVLTDEYERHSIVNVDHVLNYMRFVTTVSI